MQKKLTVLVALVGLLACSLANAELYRLADIVEASGHAEWRAQAINLIEIYEDLSAVSGVEVKVLYALDDDINAFATMTNDGEPVLVVMDGLIEYLKEDRDAVAAVIGHELAHHKANHVTEGFERAQRSRRTASFLGGLASIAVGYEHGDLAGSAAEAAFSIGGDLVALSFSRTQEYEADELSVHWLIAAGYNPEGMLRLQEHLAELSSGGASILSTHPAGERRHARCEQLINEMDVPQHQRSMALDPLVDPVDLSLSEAHIGASVY
ncbi:M48 family metalloprotease [Wenzhouxiangella sp. AB-CW3]|uniref:M48 family metalloprotease n=1 Tax=Wenzhouxiangella sp. AB-CW3 TaxID=2771012 RepID=UPI00168ADAC6|nr:M48 family metalloprotease [Wenzhouxiangella sp. AB-CW3]QOC23937.1 M48 family metalloprotease [Wenzhouxiangella sp. AB-CW3]